MSDSQTASEALPAAPAKSGMLKTIGLVLLAIGGILCFVSFNDDPRRFGFAYMMGFVFAWSIVVGSLFFIALQHVTRSVWSVVLRRSAEMLASPLAMFLLVAFFLPLLALALLNKDYTIFSWMIAHGMGNDHLQEIKAPYLNETFFIVRTIGYFAIWMFFAWFFVRGSVKQDSGTAGVKATLSMRKWSGPFLILFGFTVTFAAFDWLMSLEPSWFSTIYGVYAFSGIVLSSLAAITIAVVGLRAKGMIAPEVIKKDHLYSLGGLLFAFTCFWGYIAFSQFMLIWYANIPEETVYYITRIENGWLSVSWGVVILRFVLPFFLLLGRGAKMDGKRLVMVSVLVLVGQVVDLFWLIMPTLNPGGPTISWQELAPTVMFTGVLLLAAGIFLGRHKTVASGDPLFEKSREFHL